MGNGGKEKGRDGAVARCGFTRGGEGFLSAVTAASNEFAAAIITSAATEGDRSKFRGRCIGIRRRNGYTPKRGRGGSRELAHAQDRTVDAKLT